MGSTERLGTIGLSGVLMLGAPTSAAAGREPPSAMAVEAPPSASATPAPDVATTPETPAPSADEPPAPEGPVPSTCSACADTAPRPGVRRAAMITGWSMFGSAYLVSVVVGAAAADAGYYAEQPDIDPEIERELSYHLPAERRVAYGKRMMVPVVGPFMASSLTTTASASVATAALGVVQTVGLVVGTIGTIQYARDRRAARAYRLSAGPLPGGGGAVSVSMRF